MAKKLNDSQIKKVSGGAAANYPVKIPTSTKSDSEAAFVSTDSGNHTAANVQKKKNPNAV